MPSRGEGEKKSIQGKKIYKTGAQSYISFLLLD